MMKETGHPSRHPKYPSSRISLAKEGAPLIGTNTILPVNPEFPEYLEAFALNRIAASHLRYRRGQPVYSAAMDQPDNGLSNRV